MTRHEYICKGCYGSGWDERRRSALGMFGGMVCVDATLSLAAVSGRLGVFRSLQQAASTSTRGRRSGCLILVLRQILS